MQQTANEPDQRGDFSTALQSAVRAELEAMLKAPIFAQSGRCKKFLSHVVLVTLSGNGGDLKERTIGVQVFERPGNYDTGDDSIVRVTANEVRKRLGQFYRESNITHPVQIELPRGAYVPEFRIQPLGSTRVNGSSPLGTYAGVQKAVETEMAREPSSSAASTTNAAPARELHSSGIENEASRSPRAKEWTVLIVIIAIILTAGSIFGMWRLEHRAAAPSIWNSFIKTNAPVLLCLGAHDLHVPRDAASPNAEGKFVELVLHKQIISVDDAAVISSMASLLGSKGIPFRVSGAEQTTLTDFRRQPVILIGAMGNKWTLRLVQDLRYRITVVNPPGSDKDPIASIIDSQSPAIPGWTTDFAIPMSEWKNDYAIVARVDDPITGVPVLIEAGLGNDGSLAASELLASGSLTSGSLTSRLAAEKGCNRKANFEAVVGTEIIDAKPGPPHVLRLTCW